MKDYISVDVVSYVKNGIENGIMVPRKAEKVARIMARQGNVGETVISWSVDQDGNEVEERVSQVKIDDETKQPGWIVTKVNENGEPLVDKNGHLNQWIVGDFKFREKYEVDSENPILFKPKGGVQLFVQIPDNIILQQWGKETRVARGGYINITNVDDMYGISQRDFDDTYRFVEDLKKNNFKR